MQTQDFKVDSADEAVAALDGVLRWARSTRGNVDTLLTDDSLKVLESPLKADERQTLAHVRHVLTSLVYALPNCVDDARHLREQFDEYKCLRERA